jgi:NADPH:quinone reductase-like Zn-dependent oxidoreductase
MHYAKFTVLGGIHYSGVLNRNAYAVRTALDDSALASFPCSYSAAENMLSRAGVRAGDTVLVRRGRRRSRATRQA